MPTPTSRRSRALGASLRIVLPTLVVALLGVGGAFAAGQASVRNNVINACYATSGAQRGVLRIDTKCRKNEKPIAWNQRGLPGATGPQGADGSAGADGAAGPKGDTGATGPRGADGMMGITGLTGAKGDEGAVGPAGPAGGPQGVAGPTGPIGPAGPKGDTDAQGLRGPEGPAGAAGDGTSTAPQIDAAPRCGMGATLDDGIEHDSFLKLDGINGESRDVVYRDEIDTHGFCLGGVRAFGSGISQSLGAPHFTTFTVSMNVDSSTNKLLAKIGRGQTIATARLLARRQGEVPSPYVTYAFESLYVTSIEVRMVKGVMYQQVTFAWRKLTMSYYRSVQGAQPAPITFTQDNGAGGGAIVADAGDAVCAGPARVPTWGRSNIATTLKVGTIKGESGLTGDPFDTDGFCIGVTSVTAFTAGGGALAGKPQFTTLGFRKRIDSASPPMLQAFASGTLMPTTTLQVRGTGENSAPFLTMTFGANNVVDYQQVADASDVDEHGEIGWRTIDFQYRPQAQDGTLGQALSFTFDAATQVVS